MTTTIQNSHITRRRCHTSAFPALKRVPADSNPAIGGDCSARWKFVPRAVRFAADTFFDALGDRQEGTYRLHGQYKPDAQASACIFCVAMECTRLRIGLVLVRFHLPIALAKDVPRANGLAH